MRSKASSFGLLVLTAAFLVLAFGVSAARADFGIARWESLTCNTDVSAPGLGNWAANGVPCVKTSPSANFFTQAAGHPKFGITAFLMNQTGGTPNFPDGFIKELRTELPEGLGVNPQATPQCTVEKLSEVVAPGPPLATKCTTEVPESRVGINYFTTLAKGPAPPAGTEVTVPVLVYNIETPADPASPFYGAPSLAGFNATGKPILLVGDLNPVDQHISFTIHDLESPEIGGPPIIGSRLVFEGEKGKGYLTMPSECAGPQTTILDAISHPYPTPPGPELEATASFDTPYTATDCDKVPFDPEIDVTVNSKTDSPEPATIDLQIPFNPDPTGITDSQLKLAKVVLPDGTGINPSSANGLETCTDAQFAKGTNDPIACPTASKIGTVEVVTPSLPGVLGGTVWAAQPLSNDPSSGNQFRVFLQVFSERFGVNVRLVGNIFPNLQTGQLTAVVAENPQAPFESFKVHIDGGPRGTLTSPDTCGPHTTVAELEPWSNPGSFKQPPPTSSFDLTEAPGGGPCPKTLAERPFSPTYQAGPASTKAGAFSPFQLQIDRPDGAQEIKRVDVNLPPGMVAKLRGVAYCPEESIAAAAKQSGTAELAGPSCPSNSVVGTAAIDAGSGPLPFRTSGTAYLAGPYKGAPVSMVFVTPAVAGPYDLGTVVVRVALNVDKETAQVTAVSDPIPNVFGGVKLDIRKIDVSINRQNFTLNPTTCREPFAIKSQIFGGAANPADPAAWVAKAAESPFRASECKQLQFKPQFFARIFGGDNQTRRTANPKFRAIFDAREGDANLRRAAFILPRATILDQGHIRTICTRVQLASDTCPSKAIYGNAKATSPLLKGSLKGPVYLTSSNNPLPDLLVDLRGQVDIQLRGVISSKNGRLKTVFRRTPDVAVNKFTLTMKGGDRGLLVNSQNLCDRPRSGFLNLKAQNSRQLKSKNLRLNIPACRKG